MTARAAMATILARAGVRLLMRPLNVGPEVAAGRPVAAADAIVLLGAPLSLLFHRSRGFVAPFTCHVAAMVVTLLRGS